MIFINNYLCSKLKIFYYIKMSNNFIRAIILFLFITLVKSLDNSTLSNYEEITLTNLTGVFEPIFEEKIVAGDLTYTFIAKVDGSKIILDTKFVFIQSITDVDSGEALTYTPGEEDENLGVSLIISKEYKQNDIIKINIKFQTTEYGSSAQFLNPEQTIGGKYEYFFTMSEMIVGRELLPSQDTPAVKFPFYLGIKVKKDLYGMVSGIYDKEEEDSLSKTFFYKQIIPVPNYLIALAAGNIEGRNISETITVYSEPEFLDSVFNELSDLPEILKYAISYMGEYEWGKYNVLVLPKSFPFSGMENPCLSFCSPCLINGDKSLVDIVAHELIHSWSGNLVTNENWRDFWLNEGITMFLQRKIIGMWKGVDYAKMDGILGLFYIEEYLDIFGEDSTFTTLRPNLTGVNPDDKYSDIPYEKGYNLMYYIEGLIGEEIMKQFFQNYFAYFKYKSVDYYDFKNYFIDFCKNSNVTDDTLNKIDWDAWIFQPGRCPIENDFSNVYKEEMDKVYDKFLKEEFDVELEKEFRKFTHTSKTVFMNQLEQREEFLTDKQHDFLTKNLQLYTGQDFLVSTNYFRLILARTDKFYEHEEESLINYLSNNGALDYMTGLYELFYKRDEIKAVETLNNLKSFYHPLMVNEADEEIESAKQTFPILSLELKNKDQCLFLSTDTKIEIITEEYSFEEELNISNGVYLESDTVSVELNCFINSKEKYCLIKAPFQHKGFFNLRVPNRIQKINYAAKVHNGTSKIQAYGKEIVVDKSNNKNYDINYFKNNTQIIKIKFEKEPDENVKIIYNETEVNCKLDNLIMECIIDNNTFDYDINNKNEFKKYELKIIDLCGVEKYSFTISVKNSEEEEKNNEQPKQENNNSTIATWLIVVIIVVGLLVVAVVGFIIYKSVNKKKNEEPKEEGTDAKLMHDM